MDKLVNILHWHYMSESELLINKSFKRSNWEGLGCTQRVRGHCVIQLSFRSWRSQNWFQRPQISLPKYNCISGVGILKIGFKDLELVFQITWDELATKLYGVKFYFEWMRCMFVCDNFLSRPPKSYMICQSYHSSNYKSQCNMIRNQHELIPFIKCNSLLI